MLLFAEIAPGGLAHRNASPATGQFSMLIGDSLSVKFFLAPKAFSAGRPAAPTGFETLELPCLFSQFSLD